jgi:hypothetical protein
LIWTYCENITTEDTEKILTFREYKKIVIPSPSVPSKGLTSLSLLLTDLYLAPINKFLLGLHPGHFPTAFRSIITPSSTD